MGIIGDILVNDSIEKDNEVIDIAFDGDYESTLELKGRDLEQSLTSDKISVINVRQEGYNINDCSYIIDLEKVSNLSEISLTAIKCLLKKDGDVVIYLKRNSRVIKVGKSDGYLVYKIMYSLVRVMYGSEAKIYRIKQGKTTVCKNEDVELLRLDLGV